jgi:Dyp-type peroxidase family
MSKKKTNVPPVHANPAATVAVASKTLSAKAAAMAAQPIALDAPLRWKTATLDEQKMLRNLQGNILKGHGRDQTWNIFFEFGPDQAASKRLLRELGNFHVTDAYTQLLKAEAFRADPDTDGGTFCAAFLTSSGYAAIGLTLTPPPQNAAFTSGMKQTVADLSDPDVTAWEVPFQATIHAMVLIADDDTARGSAATRHIQDLIADAGGTVHHVQAGKAIRNTFGNGLEHFGYVDGRSQPLMLMEDVERESRDEGIAHWDPTSPLNIALVLDPLANDPAAFGSFFIFRKLEQDVAGFKLKEQQLADAMGLQGDDRERAGALVVGRFEDGTPVTLSSTVRSAPHPRNDFDYTADATASRCPFHAHIRKTNPRGSGGFEPEALEREHLMPRRGITYEDLPRLIHPDGLPESSSLAEFTQHVLPHLPTAGVGLLFMAYNSKLDNQFVFTQQTWANNAAFPRTHPNNPAAPGIDGVIGQGAAGDSHAYGNKWDDLTAGTTPFNFSGFVKMKGGEYFFAPSLMFLRSL